MRSMIACLALIGCFLSGEATADPPVLERGRQLAHQRCSPCHAVGERGDSPHARVLPFRALHERYPVEMLVEALRTGVVSGHDEMPMFEFSGADMRALISYIDSLSPGKPNYIGAPLR